MSALFNTGLHEEYFFMQCLGPFYSISVGTAETLIDTVTQCIARVQYSCKMLHSEPVQTQTVGYPVLSGTRANTIYYVL